MFQYKILNRWFRKIDERTVYRYRVDFWKNENYPPGLVDFRNFFHPRMLRNLHNNSVTRFVVLVFVYEFSKPKSVRNCLNAEFSPFSAGRDKKELVSVTAPTASPTGCCS